MSPLLATTTEDVRSRLVLLHDWPDAVLVLVGLVALAVLGLTWWNVRRARPLRRRLLLLLRLLVLLVLAAALLQPAIQEERTARQRQRLAVLVDTSRSMQLAHGEQSRAELVRRLLRERPDFWKALAERADLDFYAFDEGLRRVEADDPLVPNGAETNIDAALAALDEARQGRELAGLLLLSDGIATSEASPEESDATVEALDAPIYTYGLTGSPGLKDLAVEELRTGEFAFLLNATAIEATIRRVGYDDEAVEVALLHEGEEVARRSVTFARGRDRAEVSFPIRPDRLGKQVWTVALAERPDEVTGDNNRRSAVVRVLRDRVRVLQIAGHPSWDVRFLRNLLKRNPNVDLISFFILVNPTNLLGVSSAETSLIPFPAKELFVDELGGFDLVILQDFNYGPFNTRQHLHRVSEYVRAGGALLMIGGELAFSAGGYQNTAITEVLPVRLPPSDLPEDSLSPAPFRPVLTEAGRHHPILQLGEDRTETEQLLAALPPLEGANLFDGTTDGGVVLARHPDLRHKDAGRPILAVREVGAGRSMVFGSDASWLWSIAYGGEGGDAHVYDRFWNTAIRWLIKDPELGLVQVRAARRPRVGVPAGIAVELRRSDYRPAGNVGLRLEIRRRDERPGGSEETVFESGTEATDAAGRRTLTWTAERPGVYEIIARADIDGATREGRDLVAVRLSDPERERVVPDSPKLEQLAARSGGAFAPLDDPGDPPTLAPPAELEVTERRFEELWTSPWLLLAALLLLGGDWILRRRWGFL